MKVFFILTITAFTLSFSNKTIAQCITAPYTSCSGLPSGAINVTSTTSFSSGNIYYYTGAEATINLGPEFQGTLIVCGGPLTTNGANINGIVIVAKGGTLIIGGNSNLQGSGKIFNMGNLTVNGSMDVNTDGIINSGVMNVTGTIKFNGSGKMCMNNGAALSAGSVYNDGTNSISVPSGNACVSYSGSFGGNSPITNTSNLYVCGSGSTAASGASIGSANVMANCANCGVPLAVDLLSFQVTKQEKNIELEWITMNERNISFFRVEHAGEDGFFNHLADVTAKGKSNIQKNYTLLHENPQFGINYYRLSEIDYSGKKTNLEIRSVTINSQNTFVIYPNPTGSGVSTKINYQPKNNDSFIEFYSPVGKLVSRIELNTNSAFYEINLSAGQYIVRLIENGQPIEVKSLVVL